LLRSVDFCLQKLNIPRNIGLDESEVIKSAMKLDVLNRNLT